MKEPLSLRISDATDPDRGAKFCAVLDKKKASATDVVRGLIDAYNDTGGDIDFPVCLLHKSNPACPPVTSEPAAAPSHTTGPKGKQKRR